MLEIVSWRDAFGLGSHEHIGLVGGGGKTTTLWSMGRQLCAFGWTLATSTTKAGAPPADIPLTLWQESEGYGALRTSLAKSFAASPLLALGSAMHKDRLQSIAPEVLDSLFAEVAFIINEADGARMKPFKAPAEHEPSLASSSTLCVIVLGRDALGAPIADTHLHRPERIRALTGEVEGTPLAITHVVAIVDAYLAKVADQAPSARSAVLINKVDTGPDETTHELAAQLAARGLSAVVAASQKNALRLWRLN